MSLKRNLFSLFLLFHLFVIGVTPNKLSYFTRASSGWLEPYLNMFEFTANWNFFAPDPGPPPIYLEWEMQGQSGEDLGTQQFPDYRHSYFFLDRQNRRIAIARFMFSGDDRYIRVWGEHVCRQNPEANSVRLWRVVLDVPALDDVANDRKSLSELTVADRRSVGNLFCNGMRAK